MFQDIQTESRGFLSAVFYLTNVKLLPPALYLRPPLLASSQRSPRTMCAWERMCNFILKKIYGLRVKIHSTSLTL